jgi:hypothetical protein
MSHISRAELERLTGYKRRTIQRLAVAGQIPGAVRANGGHWRIPDSPEVRKWCKAVKRVRKKHSPVRKPFCDLSLVDPEFPFIVKRVFGPLFTDKNRALGLDCLTLVSGICHDGSSAADIARRHGVTRAAVSKRCKGLRSEFGLSR